MSYPVPASSSGPLVPLSQLIVRKLMLAQQPPRARVHDMCEGADRKSVV